MPWGGSLSDVSGADAVMKVLRQRVAPGLEVFQCRSAREVPEVALHLAGVAAVIVDDFDTAALTGGQRRALQDYVSLGGTLVLAGGAAWSRTAAALPPGLVPLRPAGSAEVSLRPLADLAAGTTAATATVVTGEVAAGLVVLAEPGGRPLVVEADEGAGRVVQLAYDPLAEPFASDQVLRGLAWDQALGRITARWGQLILASGSPVPADRMWAPTLQARPWPRWPRWGLGLLVVYIAGGRR